MSSVSGDRYEFIIAAQDAFSKELAKAQKQLQQLTGNVERMGKGTQSATNAASKGYQSMTGDILKGSAAVGLFYQAWQQTKTAVSYPFNFEMTRTSFNVLFGSVEEGQRVLAEFSEFGKKTPFTIPQVREAGMQMKAYGIETEKLIPTMRMMGDLSLGNSEKFGRLTYAYGQVQAAGKLYGTELRQFTETGIPLIQSLADHFHVTAAEIRSMTEAGSISATDVTAALEEMTAKGGQFFGLMDEGSKTLKGIWSNIQDTYIQFTEQLVDTEAYDTLRQKSAELQKSLPELFKTATDNIYVFAGAISGVLLPLVVQLGIALVAMWPLALLAAAGAAIGVLVTDFKAFGGAVTDAKVALEGFGSSGQQTLQSFDALIMKEKELAFSMRGIFAVGSSKIALWQELENANTDYAQSMERLGKSLGMSGKDIIKFQKDFAVASEKNRWTNIIDADKQKKVLEDFTRQLNTTMTQTVSQMSSNFDRITAAQKKVDFSAAIKEVQRFSSAGKEVMDKFIQEMIVKAAQAGDIGKAFGVGMANGLTAKETLTILTNAGIMVNNEMVSAMQADLFTKVRILGYNAMASLANGIRTGMPMVDSAFGVALKALVPVEALGIGSMIKNKLGNVFEQIKNAQPKVKTLGGMNTELKTLKENLEGLAVGSKEFTNTKDRIAALTKELDGYTKVAGGGASGGGGGAAAATKDLQKQAKDLAEAMQKENEKMINLSISIKDAQEDYRKLALEAGGALQKMEKDHTDKIASMNKSITDLKKNLADIRADLAKGLEETSKDYHKGQDKRDMSKAQLAVEQEQKIADIQKEIDDKRKQGLEDIAKLEKESYDTSNSDERRAEAEKQARERKIALGKELDALQAALAKESAAYKAFQENNLFLNDEMNKAREDANRTEFERSINDINQQKLDAAAEYEARRLQLKTDSEAKIQQINNEMTALETQKSEEMRLFAAARDEYTKTEGVFTRFKNTFLDGLTAMSAGAEGKIIAIQNRFESLRNLIAEVGQFDPDDQGYSFGGVQSAAAARGNTSNTSNTNNAVSININVSGGDPTGTTADQIKEAVIRALQQARLASQ